MRPTTWLAVLLVLAIFAPDAALAAETKASTPTVPKPVLATVKARFKDPVIKSVMTEMNEGSKVYELGMTVEKRNVDIMVTPAGRIVLFEREIPRQDLPAAVLATLDRRYPGATYTICEEVIKVEGQKEKLAFYEALLQTKAKQWLGVQISTQGKVLVEEKKKSGTLD